MNLSPTHLKMANLRMFMSNPANGIIGGMVFEGEEIEMMLEIDPDEKILELVIDTKIDSGMVLETIPKHFQDPNIRPFGA